jgi:hypothetical protein
MTESTSVDSKVIIPELIIPLKFTLSKVNGDPVDIPSVLSWGKEKKVLAIVGQAFKKLMPDSKDKKSSFDANDFLDFLNTLPEFSQNEELKRTVSSAVTKYNLTQTAFGRIDAAALLQFFSSEAPTLITDLVSIVTATPASDVDENFDGTSVLGFAIPYILHAMRKYAGSFAAATPISPLE